MSSFTSYPHVEVSLNPSSVYTGWLPPSTATESWKAFFDDLNETVQRMSTKEMDTFIAGDSPLKPLHDFLCGKAIGENGKPVKGTETAKDFFDMACHQNKGLRNHYRDLPLLPITSATQFIRYLGALLDKHPTFYAEMLVALPFSAVFAGIDATISGSRCLNLVEFNKAMRPVLNKWSDYLDSPDSGVKCFGKKGAEWLSDAAMEQYKFDLWKKDSDSLPYWRSWNSFFTREFKDPAAQRPVAAPDSNRIVCSPNDGQLFRWDMRIKVEDTFWLKDMNYSLREIFSSDNRAQQDLMDDYKLAEKFEGGYMFQTFLNPDNYHHWWAPVNGQVLFDPIVVEGVFFNKLVVPDFDGATTASLPYLVHVNSRGIVVFKTEDYGLVCCIPIGMSEVSTVEFDSAIKAGGSVKKGQKIGMFKYGGSSFAVLFQKVKGKDLIFHTGEQCGLYPSRPKVPTKVSVADGIKIKVGQQIGMWVDATDIPDHN